MHHLNYHINAPLPLQKDENLRKILKELEVTIIRDALESTGGAQSEAAKLLNIGRTTLVMAMKRYGIKVERKK